MTTVTEATRALVAALEPIKATLPKPAKQALASLLEALDAQKGVRQTAAAARKTSGRKSTIDSAEVLRRVQAGDDKQSIADQMGCSVNSINRIIREAVSE